MKNKRQESLISFDFHARIIDELFDLCNMFRNSVLRTILFDCCLSEAKRGVMGRYIWQYPNWTNFHRQNNKLSEILANVRFCQGKLIGKIGSLGITLSRELTSRKYVAMAKVSRSTAYREISDKVSKGLLRKGFVFR